MELLPVLLFVPLEDDNQLTRVTPSANTVNINVACRLSEPLFIAFAHTVLSPPKAQVLPPRYSKGGRVWSISTIRGEGGGTDHCMDGAQETELRVSSIKVKPLYNRQVVVF